MFGGKKNNHVIQELETGSELTLISGDPKCHCGRVGVDRGQIINGFLVYVPLIVTQWTLNPSCGISPSMERIEWTTYSVSGRVHTLLLSCGERAIVEKAKWKPLALGYL